MKRIDAMTVELTEAEKLAHRWFNILLDYGMGAVEAVQAIEEIGNQEVLDALAVQEFRDWLVG